VFKEHKQDKKKKPMWRNTIAIHKCFVKKAIVLSQHALVVVNFYTGLYIIIQNIKRHEKNIVLYATTHTKINYHGLLQ